MSKAFTRESEGASAAPIFQANIDTNIGSNSAVSSILAVYSICASASSVKISRPWLSRPIE